MTKSEFQSKKALLLGKQGGEKATMGKTIAQIA
jgi:hypothetical protein